MGRAAWAWCCTGWLAGGVALAQEAGERYVDATQSDLHWLVYKAGVLARRGHNHVIPVGDLSGSVTVDQQDLGASRFELEFPVAGLVVSDAKLRSTLGADFSSVPTAKDLGLQPFSVMGGALQVAEQLSFVYDVKARRAAR